MADNIYVYESDGKWHNRSGDVVDPGTVTPPGNDPLFAGHVPFQTLIGFNAPDEGASSMPDYAEALPAIGATGGNAYYAGNVRRLFSASPPTTTSLNNMLAKCDARNQLPVLSFKVNDRWDEVAQGLLDNYIDPIVTVAKARRTANGGNGKPFLVGFHHEPNSNGPTTDNLTNLTWWGLMQLYSLNYVTGWKSRGATNVGGTYVAADDVRDIVSWAPIANGFFWGTKFSYPDRIAACYPPDLIDAFNDRGGPLGADMYDPTLDNITLSYDSNNYRIEASFVYPSNYDRCWREIQTMVAWARTNNVKSIGFGEMGNTNQANWQATIDQLMLNRDIISYALVFNNLQNSKWDWRLIPQDWGDTNGFNPTQTVGGVTVVDYGGDPLSSAYIVKYKNLVDRSITETDPF